MDRLWGSSVCGGSFLVLAGAELPGMQGRHPYGVYCDDVSGAAGVGTDIWTAAASAVFWILAGFWKDYPDSFPSNPAFFEKIERFRKIFLVNGKKSVYNKMELPPPFLAEIRRCRAW